MTSRNRPATRLGAIASGAVSANPTSCDDGSDPIDFDDPRRWWTLGVLCLSLSIVMVRQQQPQRGIAVDRSRGSRRVTLRDLVTAREEAPLCSTPSRLHAGVERAGELDPTRRAPPDTNATELIGGPGELRPIVPARQPAIAVTWSSRVVS